MESNKQTRSKKLGRAARRRKAKSRCIQEAVQAILNPSSVNSSGVSTPSTNDSIQIQNALSQLIQDSSDKSVLPVDRGHVLPGVRIRRCELQTHTFANKNSTTRTTTTNNDTGNDTINSTNGQNNNKQTDDWSHFDYQMLTSQLGYIPGNGVAVAARVKDIQDKFPYLSRLLLHQLMHTTKSNTNISNNNNIQQSIQNSSTRNEMSINKDENDNDEESLMDSNSLENTPIILKLYPLAIRDIHHGGKAGGRKFKSRKRGRLQSINDDGVCTHDNDDGGGGGDGDDNNHDRSENVNDIASNECETINEDVNDCHNKDNVTTGAILEQDTRKIVEPFPTMFWMTHPYLKTLVSQLEIGSTHNVKIMETKLSSNQSYLQSMKHAHSSYGTERFNLLTNADLTEIIQKNKWEGAIGIERGVAGIRRFDTIKCLHAHAAHYLACPEEKNVVGQWVMEAVEEMVQTRDGLSS